MKLKIHISIIFLLATLSITAVEKDTISSRSFEFIENKGQWNENTLFYAFIPDGGLFLEKNCLTFNFKNKSQLNKILEYKNNHSNEHNNKFPEKDDYLIDCFAYKLKFNQCNSNCNIIKSDINEGYFNFYIGNNQKKWASKVNSYKEITYSELYNGIDFKIFENNTMLKYEFIVKKGNNPKNIELIYEGAEAISIQQENLLIKAGFATIVEIKPYAYQEINGEKITVKCKYKTKGNKVLYSFPEGYDKEYDLIIDPTLIFSGVTGSTADNWGFTATYDNLGNIFSGGIAFGIGQYPSTTGAYQMYFAGGESTSYNNGCDIAVMKYNPTGTARMWATYLGGAGDDLPHSMICDASDNLIIFGSTGSLNFPTTTSAYDNTFNGGTNHAYDYNSIHFSHGIDIYISKISANGSQLLASTYLGGTGNDGLNDPSPLSYNYADGARGEVMIDRNDNIYIVSTTFSNDFPVTSSAFQQFNAGGQDGCICVFNYDLSDLIWSSYFGGSGSDILYGIKVSKSDDIYVCGGTTSSNFPVTMGAKQTTYGGGTADGFIAKIAYNGSQILKSTYWGSAEYDQTYLLDIDRQNNVYVFGQTKAPGSFYIYNAAWFVINGGQFISKFNPDLSGLVWSTAFGVGTGLPDISPTALLVDLCNQIYMSGWGSPGLYYYGNSPVHGTNGLPTTPGAQQVTTDGNDFYLLEIPDDASTLSYATYYGGPQSQEHVDGGTSRFDRKGKIYQSVCADCGHHDDFPYTPGAYCIHNGSNNCNNGCFKFDFLVPAIVADFILPPVICAPDSVHFINTSYSGASISSYYWTFGDGTPSSIDENPTHFYSQSGVYNVTLICSNPGSCNFFDTITKQLVVLSNITDTLPTQYICSGLEIQIGIPPVPDTSVTYIWSPSYGLNNIHISNPIANPSVSTIYTLLISNGVCTDTLIQEVLVYNLIEDILGDTLTCLGNVNLTIISDGFANYFQWSSNPNFTDTLNSNTSDSIFNYNITQPTTFYVLVKNNYCQSIDSITINFTFNTDTSYVTAPVCHDECNAMAGVYIINPNSPPYTYQWNLPTHYSDTLQNVCAGNYTCTITDSAGCISIAHVYVPNPAQIDVNFQIFHLPCKEICIGSITTSVSGGIPPYQYHWNTGDSTAFIENLCQGSYIVTISDIKHCTVIDTVIVEIHSVFDSVDIYADNYYLYSGQSTGLHATHYQNVTYEWNPSTWLDNPSSSDPVSTPNDTITYILTLRDQYGCTASDTLTLYVKEVICDEAHIFIPNAFTPNGDNINDVFLVRTQMAQDIYLAVYDRWGEKVFDTKNVYTGWDGTYRSKLCEPDVYVFILDVTCWNKEVYKKKGNVTLIR